ncbi:hypothetical protein E4U42_003746 [Claviceps africana]|uniref:Uncharacterized protein n=1 Tax=Claviceps africana TaxID=83212 RepID=A0A8K0NHJ6_9HYPO|nr:hypothetical protein E4U42_003746 [Claviceps africana]
MVTTRSRAARLVDERLRTAADSSNTSRHGRKRRRSEISEDTNEDAHSDSAPEGRAFYRDITKRASVGEGRRKKSKHDDQETVAEPDESPSYSLSSSSPSPSQAEEQEYEGTSAAPSRAEEHEYEETSASSSQAEELEYEETSEHTQSLEPQYEEQPKPAYTETPSLENEPGMHAENITWIASISVDMKYIEPEPEGVKPVMCFIDCSEINDLIHCMKREGWTSVAGDWSLELLALDDEDEAENKWAAPTKKSDSRNLKLFLEQTVEIGNFVHAMPKNPRYQSRRLRECSKEATLYSMRDVAEKMKQQVRQAEKQASKANEARNRKLVEAMRTRLVPLLVLVLKEALLLGGSSRMCAEDWPEEIGPEKGNFMACTLQFPLHIIGCIDQLWPVIEDSVEEADRRKMFWLFGERLSALRKTLLKGMETLRENAEKPQRLLQMKENDERTRQLRDEEMRRTDEELRRRLHVFSASTHEKWSDEEDLKLMRFMRRVTNLNAEVAAKEFPNRTVADVSKRMEILKARARSNYIKLEKEPARWCC